MENIDMTFDTLIVHDKLAAEGLKLPESLNYFMFNTCKSFPLFTVCLSGLDNFVWTKFNWHTLDVRCQETMNWDEAVIFKEVTYFIFLFYLHVYTFVHFTSLSTLLFLSILSNKFNFANLWPLLKFELTGCRSPLLFWSKLFLFREIMNHLNQQQPQSLELSNWNHWV